MAARAMAMTAVSAGCSGMVGAGLSTLKDPGLAVQLRLTPTLNSILAGLVGITGCCAVVELEGALLVGAGAVRRTSILSPALL